MNYSNNIEELQLDIAEMECLINRGEHLEAADTITQEINYIILEGLRNKLNELINNEGVTNNEQ